MKIYEAESSNTQVVCENWSDSDGNPSGGVASGPGFCISWQQGPVPRDENGERRHSGAFIEHVVLALINRLEFFQASRFACQENADMLLSLNNVLSAELARTRDRVARGVEGQHIE